MAHLRDKEISRIIKYAEGLGLKVEIKAHKKNDPGATWDRENGTITVYQYKRQSKTDLILVLLHELGHQLDWIYNHDRQVDKVIEAALDAEDARQEGDPYLPKEQRYLIYKDECAGIAFMPVIANELGLKIPLWKVEIEAELDKWSYAYYWENGHMPSPSECKEKRRELRANYDW